MGGAVSGLAPILKVAAPIISTLLSSSAPEAPSASPAPQAPDVVKAPEAPEMSSAADVDAKDPATEAAQAKVRAQKRRQNSSDAQLFSLSSEDSEAVVLTKSLLGE